MSRKKTQHGVEMRSTFGMKSNRTPRTWVVAADRTQAKIFEWTPQHHSLIEIKTWKNPIGKKKESKLVSDQPGRVFNSRTFARGGHQTAGPRHSYSTELDPAEHEAMVFAKKISDWIKKVPGSHGEIEIMIVAEPHFMGVLHQQMTKNSALLVKKKWRQDLSWVQEPELRLRIVRWLSGKVSSENRILPRRIGAFGYNKKTTSP